MTGRLTVVLLVFLAMVSFGLYLKSHPKDQWRLIGCKAQDDGGTRITLRGSSVIEAEGDSHQAPCGVLRMGTKFKQRDGTAICTDLPGGHWSSNNPFGKTCYEIVSEIAR